MLTRSTRPRLIVQGSRDAFGPIDDVRALVESLPEPKRLVTLAGADHSLEGYREPLEEAVGSFARELAGG